MKKIVAVMVSLCAATGVEAQSIAVNTDVAMLALQTYNVGAEMTIGNRSTLGLGVFTTNNPYWGKDTKAVGVQPEYRYYFGGRPMYHHFVGVSGLAVDYDTKIKNTRYDGFAVGGGVTFGYVVSLSNRWTIDAHAGVGVVVYHQKKTMDGVPDLSANNGTLTTHGYMGYQLLPTKIGVTLSYIIR